MKEQWIEELRQKMADYKEPAPEVSWDEIKKAVAAQRRKVVPMWFRKIAAVVLFLIISFVGYIALDHVKHTDRSNDSAQNHRPVPSVIQAETAKQDTPAGNPLLATVTQAVRQAFHSAPIAEIPSEAAEDDNTPKESDSVVEQAPQEEQTSQHQEAHTEHKQTDIYHSLTTIYPSDLRKSPTLRNRLTAKVYLSNAMGNSRNFSIGSYSYEKIIDNPVDPGQGPKGDMPDKGDFGDKGKAGDAGDKGDKGDGGGGHDGGDNPQKTDTGDQPKETTTIIETVTTAQQTHHYQPIRYGLSLRYRLNERWAVETGLTYSLLASDITTTDGRQTTQWKQRLNYIGIPLKAEYLLWDSRYFNVYASAGMMLEKMVKGSLEDIKTGTKEGLSIRPLQFSVNGAVGAEFNLSRQFSIYAEPGIGYYFDNGSSVSTFYQDKPLSFNLNVGLRFSFE